MDSPSRSGSVASRTSDASLTRRLQMRDLFLLAAGNDVVRRELLVDIYTKATPVLVLDLLGNLRGRFGQIADVAIARFDTVFRAKKPAEGLCLRRRFDDHQRLRSHTQLEVTLTRSRGPHETAALDPLDPSLQFELEQAGQQSTPSTPLASASASRA